MVPNGGTNTIDHMPEKLPIFGLPAVTKRRVKE